MSNSKKNTILLSIKTEYANKILNGSKKYEFRGWKLPDNVEYVVIYSSGVEKKIVGQFRIEKVIEDTPEKIWSFCQDKAGASEKEFYNYVYSFNYDKIYAIKIKDIKSFSNFLPLSDIDDGFFAPQRFKYLTHKQIETIKRRSI